MVVQAEVKYKGVFQSKYEAHSSQIEVSMFYQQAFDFSVFRYICGFSEKKNWSFYYWGLCEKM